MLLDEKQQNVINYCKKGKNVFVTGPGGTGKSFLIKEFKKTNALKFTYSKIV